jgi:hypothetical protein
LSVSRSVIICAIRTIARFSLRKPPGIGPRRGCQPPPAVRSIHAGGGELARAMRVETEKHGR